MHLGRNDPSFEKARWEMGDNAIIGISCYNSPSKALKFAELGASYVALGSFSTLQQNQMQQVVVFLNYKNLTQVKCSNCCNWWHYKHQC